MSAPPARGGGGGFVGGGGGAAVSANAGGGGGGGSSFGPGGASYGASADPPSVAISWTVSPPTAHITSPASGATYSLGQTVHSNFTCAEGVGGQGIAGCLDQSARPSGAPVDTSVAGAHTFTVTATSHDGLAGHASDTYTVAAAPSTQISSPANGATYTRGQIVDAGYRCLEGVGGPGLASCAGTVANGQPVDTTSLGVHSLTVTAISRDGQRATAAVSYTVVLPDNHFTVTRIRTHADGKITFAVKVPGPGRIDALATAWDDNIARVAILLEPAPHRFVYARAHHNTRRTTTVLIRVTPNTRGKLLIHHHTYPVLLRLWVSYTPTGGIHRSIGFHGLHLPTA